MARRQADVTTEHEPNRHHREAVATLIADRRLTVPLAALVVLVLFAILMPIAWSHNPDTQNLIGSLQRPSLTHPLGTDQLGRDVLARVADGARISLVVATLVTLAGAIVGGLIGLLAGAVGGIGDGVAMRVMDAPFSIVSARLPTES